jgi:hypothetical protein
MLPHWGILNYVLHNYRLRKRFTWLYGYMVTWLHGYMVTWLHINYTIVKDSIIMFLCFFASLLTRTHLYNL